MSGIPLLALPPDPVGGGRRANDYLETSCSACFGHQPDVCENSFDRAGLAVVLSQVVDPAGDDHARRIVDNYVVIKTRADLERGLTADALGQVVVVGKEGLVVGTSLPYFRNGVADQYGSRTLQTPFGHCRRLLANAAQLVAGSRI